MGVDQARDGLPDDAAQFSEDERRARINEIALSIAENSRELLERLARRDQYGSEPT
ncbi:MULTISPECIES: hypothetical protein [Mycobacteriaceae]|uniref:hypothetical protein n=1 Tax=Mycobacteriaceae TaxID=1762 RepID=UPI0009C6B5E9|nr:MULTISPECIES: hypothetical protein [Mycobacteriaceae]MCQ4363453.1 hypothetical protein [Mycobacterium gordonae]MDX1880980.1 hypothetical protein [Mycolicibacterium sp. 141076]SKT73505.1 Uncharacterised protein [Mycobacteroides abscessus subsp. massiliense]SKU00048.1 Uncharacterised protein [Mycobacteroides abscessus subsp. massiliense]